MRTLAFAILMLVLGSPLPAPQKSAPVAYLGFDRNDYPGDVALPILRKTFSFAGYWLSPPPGEESSTWLGRRAVLRSQGFGFVLLYRGRDPRGLKNADDAARLGETDAHSAAAAAKRERFPKGAIIFLDIEQGGRLSPTYHAYIHGWLWTLTQLDYGGGFYCSGIPVKEDAHISITTADDIISFLFLKSRHFTLWVYNDSCPPSPGCIFQQNPLAPSGSGISYAAVWQFVRSPRDNETARNCTGYATNGNCYTALDLARQWHLDLDVANSPDPSGTR
jgi:Rv2525c-like, glycoside hydrolase-like domain